MLIPLRVVIPTAVAMGLALILLPPRMQAQGSATYTVTTTTDSPHTLPLDGNCTSQLPGNLCTLRAAIQAANFSGGSSRISLAIS